MFKAQLRLLKRLPLKAFFYLLVFVVGFTCDGITGGACCVTDSSVRSYWKFSLNPISIMRCRRLAAFGEAPSLS